MLENSGRLRNKIHLNVFILIIDGVIPVFLYTDTSSLNTDSASDYRQKVVWFRICLLPNTIDNIVIQSLPLIAIAVNLVCGGRSQIS